MFAKMRWISLRNSTAGKILLILLRAKSHRYMDFLRAKYIGGHSWMFKHILNIWEVVILDIWGDFSAVTEHTMLNTNVMCSSCSYADGTDILESPTRIATLGKILYNKLKYLTIFNLQLTNLLNLVRWKQTSTDLFRVTGWMKTRWFYSRLLNSGRHTIAY